VRGLDLDGITVTGNDGAVLYPAPKNDGELGEAMRLRNDFEHRLEGKVSALLTRIMGENRYAVQIAVDVDASHVSSSETQYGKGDTTILSEEHSQTPVSGGATSGGVPGLTSNLPNASANAKALPSASPSAAAPSASATTTAQTESQGDSLARKDIVNYKPSIRETHSETAPFRIKRITVAAVLDGTYEHGAYKPLDDARLHAIKELVAAAVGADVARGDAIDVQTAPLSQPYVAPLPNPIDQFRMFVADPIHLYETAGVVLLAFIFLIWMMKRALSRRSSRKRAVAEAAAEKSEEQAPAPAPVETPAPAPAPEQKSERGFDEIRRKVNEEVERNPQAAAEILRRWLAEGVAAGNGNAAPAGEKSAA